MEYIVLLIASLVILNIYVTWIVLSNDLFKNNQKSLQTFIVWFVPVIGAITVLYFHKEPQIENKIDGKIQEGSCGAKPYADADDGGGDGE